MWRQAAELVPSHYIGSRSCCDFIGVGPGQYFASNEPKADAVPVTYKPGAPRYNFAQTLQGLIAASCSYTIRFFEQLLFNFSTAASPFCDFKAGAQLRVGIIKRMRKQP